MKDLSSLPYSKIHELVEHAIQSSGAMKPSSFARSYTNILASTQVARVFEIGIHKANSLRMWRSILGSDVEIIALDIKKESCELASEIADHIYCGSQADQHLIDQIVARHSPFSVIVDDGSHLNKHMTDTLKLLFPSLQDNGAYLVEDVFTSYWPSYKGGYKLPGTFIETIKDAVDGLYQRFSTPKYERHFNGNSTILIPVMNSLKGLKIVEFDNAGLVVLRN